MFPHHSEHFTVTELGFALLFRLQRIYALIEMSHWLWGCIWNCMVGEWHGEWVVWQKGTQDAL